MTFEVFRSKKDQKFYFELKDKKGEVLLYSQGYVSKAGCLKGIRSVRKNCTDTHKYESKEKKGKKSRFVLKAKNGEIIGDGPSQTSNAAVKATIKVIMKGATKASLAYLKLKK